MTPASSAAVVAVAVAAEGAAAVAAGGVWVVVVAAAWVAAAVAWAVVLAQVAACHVRPAAVVDLLPLVDPLRLRALAGATQAARDPVALVRVAAPSIGHRKVCLPA